MNLIRCSCLCFIVRFRSGCGGRFAIPAVPHTLNHNTEILDKLYDQNTNIRTLLWLFCVSKPRENSICASWFRWAQKMKNKTTNKIIAPNTYIITLHVYTLYFHDVCMVLFRRMMWRTNCIIVFYGQHRLLRPHIPSATLAIFVVFFLFFHIAYSVCKSAINELEWIRPSLITPSVSARV